jgi:hypothetical protein
LKRNTSSVVSIECTRRDFCATLFGIGFENWLKEVKTALVEQEVGIKPEMNCEDDLKSLINWSDEIAEDVV